MYDPQSMAMELEIAKRKNYEKWRKELPAFHFDEKWEVKIIPPFAGAVIRFYISYKDKFVSVYFDSDSSLGFMYDDNDNPIPYFECYDGQETYRYLIDEAEEMMSEIREYLNSEDD